MCYRCVYWKDAIFIFGKAGKKAIRIGTPKQGPSAALSRLGDHFRVLSGPHAGKMGKLVESLGGRPPPLKVQIARLKDGDFNHATSATAHADVLLETPPAGKGFDVGALLVESEIRASQLRALHEELIVRRRDARELMRSTAQDQQISTKEASSEVRLSQLNNQCKLDALNEKMIRKGAALEAAKEELNAMTAMLQQSVASIGAVEEIIAEKEREIISINGRIELQVQVAQASLLIASAAAAPSHLPDRAEADSSLSNANSELHTGLDHANLGKTARTRAMPSFA
eukprot:536268-Prymnesium_polylepis.1